MVGHSGTGPEAERLVEWSKPPRTVICLARGTDVIEAEVGKEMRNDET